MAISKVLNLSEITTLLLEDEYAGWTYEGACALAHYMHDLSRQTGDIDFNCVRWRCDYNEHASLSTYNADYGTDYASWHDCEHLAQEFYSECGLQSAIVYNH